MWLALSSGPRSIHAPVEQKLPTFDDANELTTSGGLPLRIAAMIFGSRMPPVTSTWTLGFFWLYSAISALRTLSSCVEGRKPTQNVIFVGPVVFAVYASEVAVTPAAASTAAASATTVATRFMEASWK